MHAPEAVVRAALPAAGRPRLRQVDTVWVDMDSAVPVTDTSRARTGPGRPPAEDDPDVSTEMAASTKDAALGTAPVLRPRTALGAAIRQRPAEVRRCP